VHERSVALDARIPGTDEPDRARWSGPAEGDDGALVLRAEDAPGPPASPPDHLRRVHLRACAFLAGVRGGTAPAMSSVARLGRSGAGGWRRRDDLDEGRCAQANAQLPAESVGRRARDADVAQVHAVQVVRSAEAGEFPGLVRAARRAVFDVVSLRRLPAATRDLAEVPIAREDLLPQGIPLFPKV